MALVEFIEFTTLEELKKYCSINGLILRSKNGFSVIAEILDRKNVLWGSVSNRPEDYKCTKPDTKYVLIWE